MGRLGKPKAVLAALVAFLVPFLTALVNNDHVTWRAVVVAVVAGLVALEGVYRLPHKPGP